MVPILGVWLILAPAIDAWPFSGGSFAFPAGTWFPKLVNDDGEIIDQIFYGIFYLTGPIFIATGIALFWFMWKYDSDKNTAPVKFSHGSHTLEIVWSILPAVTLLFLAVYQMNAWADHKMRRPLDHGPDGVLNTADDPMLPGPDKKMGTDDDRHVLKPPLALITGRQFQWDIRYAGDDRKFYTRDDLFTNTDLHIPVEEEIVLQVESQDVLHSFFLPNMRVKQDVVPGMTQFVWFKPNKTGAYDIVCAELCGWGHYKMRGQLTVQKKDDFEKWIEELKADQNKTSFAKPKVDE